MIVVKAHILAFRSLRHVISFVDVGKFTLSVSSFSFLFSATRCLGYNAGTDKQWHLRESRSQAHFPERQRCQTRTSQLTLCLAITAGRQHHISVTMPCAEWRTLCNRRSDRRKPLARAPRLPCRNTRRYPARPSSSSFAEFHALSGRKPDLISSPTLTARRVP